MVSCDRYAEVRTRRTLEIDHTHTVAFEIPPPPPPQGRIAGLRNAVLGFLKKE
jgi:hypothetical protein